MDWSVFKKEGVESKPEPRPQAPRKPQQGRSQHAVGDGRQPSREETPPEQAVDFEALPDDGKQAWSYAVNNYHGNVDPEQWAMYHAQKDGLNASALLQAATTISNIVRKYGAVSIEYVPDTEKHKWPWWSAARDWNPDSPIWGNKQWSPSQPLLNGITYKY